MAGPPALRDALRVEPGSRVRLEQIDAGATFGREKATAVEATQREMERLGRPPGSTLGGGQAVRPRRPPGDRRRRQGRDDQQGHGGVQPAGLPGHVVQGPDPRGARPRLPVARPQANAAEGRDRRSSTARTTRTCSSSASTSSSRGRSGRRATTRSTTSRRCSTAQRHDDRQVLPVDRSRRAARSASRRATTTRRSAGSSPRRPRGAEAAGTTTRRRSTRPCRRRRRRRPRGTSSRPTASGSGTWRSRRSWPTRIAELKPAYPPAPDLPADLVIE